LRIYGRRWTILGAVTEVLGKAAEVPFYPSLIFQARLPAAEAQVAPCSTNIFLRL
jgi:hypothetical protein